MTFDEVREHMKEYDGWCTECKDVTQYGGVEPDAREYKCPDCGNNTVYGMEQAAAIMMVVPFDEEEGE